MYTIHPKAQFGEVYREPVFKADGTPNGNVCHVQEPAAYLQSVEDRRHVEIANLAPRYDGNVTLMNRVKAILDRCQVYSITIDVDKISAVIHKDWVKHFYLLAQGVDCDENGEEIVDGEGNGKLLPGEN